MDIGDLAAHLLNEINWPALALKCGLSPRQTQVAQGFLLAEERSEIAAHLKIKLGTLKNHIQHLYAKLGVKKRNRTDLILRLLAVHEAMAKG